MDLILSRTTMTNTNEKMLKKTPSLLTSCSKVVVISPVSNKEAELGEVLLGDIFVVNSHFSEKSYHTGIIFDKVLKMPNRHISSHLAKFICENI